MTITAVIIPNSRVSISAKLARHEGAVVAVADGIAVLVVAAVAVGEVTEGGGSDDGPSGPSVLASSVMCSPPRHSFSLYTKRAPRP
jgi:hypothetical protein